MEALVPVENVDLLKRRREIIAIMAHDIASDGLICDVSQSIQRIVEILNERVYLYRVQYPRELLAEFADR